MSKLISLVCVASVIVFAAGCADHGDYVAFGADGAYDDYPYDGYYDGFYGPFSDGYWGNDGFFYFSDGRRAFRRDNGNHFRHEASDGFHGIHSHPSGFGAGGGGPRSGGEARTAGGGGFREGGGGHAEGGGRR